MLILGSSLFLSQFLGVSTKNKPVIGWQSIIAPAMPEISGDITTTMSELALWSPDTDSLWESDPITSGSAIVGYLQLFDGEAVNPVDYFGMIADNFAMINASFTLQYYDDEEEVYVDVEGVTDQTPTNDKLRFFYFPPAVSTSWRLKIMHPGGTDVVFKIGHIKLGTALVLQRATYIGITPPTLNRDVNKLNQRAKGKYLNSVVRDYHHKYEIKQPNNDPAFVRNYIDPFIQHMEGILRTGTALTGYGPLGTCFYAWRWDEYPEEVVYCGSYESIIPPRNTRANRMMEWEMSGNAEL